MFERPLLFSVRRPSVASPFAKASVVGLALLVGVAAGACSERQASAGDPPQGPPPMPVKLETVRQARIEDATEYVASLRPLRSTLVQPQVDGQITRIDVTAGDRVKAGDPIVQIDGRRQQAAVSSREATQAALEAAVTLAKSELERAQTLLQAGAISRQQVEQASTALKTAEANLRAQQAQIEEGQVQLRYYTVTAPRAGIIGDVPVRVGNQVTSSTVLTSVDEITSLEVNVQVPIERAPDLRPGLPLRVLGPDGAPVAATTITFVSPRVDDATQAVLVKGIVTNPGSLRAMQSVRAQVVWRTTSGVLIPVLAVTRVSDQYFAFVAAQKNGGLAATQRPIKVGSIVGNDYVLLGGIKPDERIVVSGVQKLADGAPIAPLPESQRSSQ